MRDLPAPSPVASPAGERTYRLEQIDEAAVVQLYADGFTDLSLNEKVIVWHLYLAALAGRDIYYDQRYVHNLAMRDILEEIVSHASGIDPGVLAEVTRYTKPSGSTAAWHNNLTARKFVLQLPLTDFVAAAEQAARAGARFRLAPGEAVAELIDRYAPMFFDPAVDPMVTCKTPGAGRDIPLASANNPTTASRWTISQASSSAIRSIRASSSRTARLSSRSIASAARTTRSSPKSSGIWKMTVARAGVVLPKR